MYEIKLTVDAPGLTEAIHHLATAIESRPAPSATKRTKKSEKDPAPTVEVAPTPAPETQIPAAEIPPVQIPAAEIPPEQTAPSAAPVTTPAQKALTLTDISNAGAELVDGGLMPQLVSLLGKYGVQTVMALDPSKYEAFAVDLRALGANI